MRHAKARLQLNRFTSWRKATLHSLARSILINQSIRTTLVKAKASKPLVEKLISLAKEGTLAARRKAYDILQDHRLVRVLFSEIGPRFVKRNGGYTRIIHWGQRRGDNASVVLFELTEIKKDKRKKNKKKQQQQEGLAQKPGEEVKEAVIKEKPAVEKHQKTVSPAEKPEKESKPTKKFLGGLRNIFKKERDSL